MKLILEGNNITTVQTTALKGRRKLASGKKKKGIQGEPKWDWGDTTVLASLLSKGSLWLLGNFKKLQTNASVVGLQILQAKPYHEMTAVKWMVEWRVWFYFHGNNDYLLFYLLILRILFDSLLKWSWQNIVGK